MNDSNPNNIFEGQWVTWVMPREGEGRKPLIRIAKVENITGDKAHVSYINQLGLDFDVDAPLNQLEDIRDSEHTGDAVNAMMLTAVLSQSN